ncbi:MAG: hypothetical protein II691_03545 [Muribaculaceae bacterium]|nr:hypothetical protein [Muribaculaceae bacterium]MBQ3910371.1 hypothetical protein [Muribaculaceae bacterium]MBQ5509484.1 hypothetical protein [Muribaculaceae bacterium]MBQ6648355.1 hypothetical protein [Muribaculaceae bacterium]
MKKKIKRAILILAALLLVAGVALSVTNPSSNDHLNVIADYLSNYDMSQIDLNEEEQAQYTAYMSSGANANLMDKVVKPMFRVQDYGLWSVGKINEKNVTLGILNKVMIIDGDQIPKALVERNKVEDADK